MPAGDPNSLSNEEKLDLIDEIEASIVPGADDVDAKMKQIGDLWESVCDSGYEFTISDELMEELERQREEYLRNPEQGTTIHEIISQLTKRV